MNIDEHLDLLGRKAKDKVTGFTGIIDSISFDLYGCIQAALKPFTLDKEGMIKDGCYFDITRLTLIGSKRSVDMPRFDLGYVADGKKGAAQKPTTRA